MLGFSPLASAPLSDDGIVIVSSSITLIGKESQVIHNDVEGVNNSTKVITTVSSVTDVNDLQVNLTKPITTVSSVTDVNDLQVNLTKSITTVSSITDVNDLQVNLTKSITTVSSVTDVNDVVGGITKSITTVSSVTDVNDLQVNLTKSITTVSSVTDVNDLQVNLTKSITTVSSVTDVNDLQVNLTKSITTVSSVTDVNDLQVNLTKSITTVSSVTDVNDVEGVNNSTKLVSSIFSQVTQGSLSTTVDITLSSTSTTGQLGTINRVVGVSTTLDSVSTASQVGTTAGSTSSNKTVTSVSATGSVNGSSASTSSNKAITSVSATSQVRTPQIGPSEHLVAVSVTGNVTRPLLIASSNKSLVNVSSSATVNTLVTLVETALSGVSSSVDVNDLPFVGVPVNATVNLGDSLTPNLYYSGQVYNSVYYTSSSEYEGFSVKVELEFKIDSSASNTEQQFLFDSRNPAYGHSGWNNYFYAYKYGSTVTVGLALISSLLRGTIGSFNLNYSFSKETWYKLSIFNSGQRLYAIVYNATTGQQLHSQNILMSVSYGSYSSSSYKFFLDDFLLGNGTNQNSTEYFEGLLHNVKVYVPSSTLRAKVWSQRTSVSNPSSSIPGAHVNPLSDWADAQSNFSNNAANGSTASTSDIPVFESPSLANHLVTTSGSASAVATLVTSNVAAFPTGVSSSAQAQTLEETLVSSSKTLVSTFSVAVLRAVNQTHSSNKTLPSADFTSSVNDVDKSASSSVILDTVNSQASVTDLVSLTTDTLTGVSSSVTFNNLSVKLSAPLTTVSSASQVSDLVVDIDEIIPPSLSVSSQVSVGQVNAGGGTTLSSISSSSEINPVVLGVLLEKVEAEVTLTPVVIGVPITGVSSSSQTNALEATITELIGSVSSSASVNSVTPVSNGTVTVGSVSSLTDVNGAGVFNNSTIIITKVQSDLSDLRDVVGVSSSNKTITSVSSLTDVNDVSIVTISNGSTTLDSVSSTTSTPNQLSVSTDEVANLIGVEAGTAVQFGGVESQEAILRKVTTLCQVGTLTINVGVTLPSASSTFNASEQVKGVINVSVQLSTLPLVTVSRGSITLSTDGFNFEEFKNAYDRARTVYVSRAA